MPKLNDPWDDSPLPTEDDPNRYVVTFRGIGPDAGPESRHLGCTCPGMVGDLDKYGRKGGCTIDNECPHHGREARRKHDEEATRNLRELMASLDGYR